MTAMFPSAGLLGSGITWDVQRHGYFHDQLCAVTYAELLEDRMQVALNRVDADRQSFSDFGILQTGDNKFDGFGFTFGESKICQSFHVAVFLLFREEKDKDAPATMEGSLSAGVHFDRAFARAERYQKFLLGVGRAPAFPAALPEITDRVKQR